MREYNLELKRLAGEGKGTWFTCPWLFAECVEPIHVLTLLTLLTYSLL